MTKPWKPDGLFAGQTVAVLASGPSLTQELADAVRHLPRVCARWACKMAPDADIVIAIDDYPNEGFWDYALANFPGIKLTGAYQSKLPDEVGYFWHRYEFVKLTPTNEISFRNNGMSAIHIAEQSGAAKILLLGFDPETSGRFYDNEKGYPGQVGEWYPGLTNGIAALIKKLREQGVKVERINTVEDAQQHAPAPYPGHVPPRPWPDGMGEGEQQMNDEDKQRAALSVWNGTPEERVGGNKKRK